MKSKFNILMGGLIAVTFIFSSCVNDDPYDFPSVQKPIVTPTGGTEFTVTEGETLQIPFTTNRPISEPMEFKFIIEQGDAERVTDYTIGEGPIGSSYGNPETMFIATVPAYAESFDIPFSALSDLIPEGSEQIQLRMKAVGVRTALTPDGGILFTFNIEQIISDNFIFYMEWDTEYIGTDGEPYTLCGYDLDLEIYNSTGTTIVATSYSSCPEQITLAPGDLPDGDYLLVPSYYSPTGSVPPDPNIDTNPASIPAVVTLAKQGVFNTTIDLTGVWTDFAAGAAEGNPDAYQVIGLLNIQGSTYTVTDPNTGDVIVQGRTGRPVSASALSID